MKVSEMNMHQKLAFAQVINASNWVLGGYENEMNDEIRDEMPTREQLFDEIYDTVMTCTTFPGFQSSRPIKEIRFAGEVFIKERINRRLTKEGF